MTDLDKEPTQPVKRRRMARGSFVPRRRNDDLLDILFLTGMACILGLAVLVIVMMGRCE